MPKTAKAKATKARKTRRARPPEARPIKCVILLARDGKTRTRDQAFWSLIRSATMTISFR
jgi:hypothetical protein